MLLPVEAVAVVELEIVPEFVLLIVIELEFISANASGAAIANVPIAVANAVAIAADFRNIVLFIYVVFLCIL